MPVRQRIFHCSEGTSHKFWSATVDGTIQTVRWGRIGTEGQALERTFDTADEAAADTEKLIAQKRKRGYAEVDAAAHRTTPTRKRAPRTVAQQMALPL